MQSVTTVIRDTRVSRWSGSAESETGDAGVRIREQHEASSVAGEYVRPVIIGDSSDTSEQGANAVYLSL